MKEKEYKCAPNQLSEKGMVRTRCREKPVGEENEGTKGADIKRCMKSICFGLERGVPLDNPSGIGFPGTARALPSSVLGVDLSSSQKSPSITHRSFFIFNFT